MDDGDTIKILIASDCENVKSYAELLGEEIRMSDIIEWSGSKVVDPQIGMPLSMPCLVPISIMDVAWMGIGMLGPKTQKKRETTISHSKPNENDIYIRLTPVSFPLVTRATVYKA